jgi:predicted NBD/HSP70 family sugar kinase
LEVDGNVKKLAELALTGDEEARATFDTFADNLCKALLP